MPEGGANASDIHFRSLTVARNLSVIEASGDKDLFIIDGSGRGFLLAFSQLRNSRRMFFPIVVNWGRGPSCYSVQMTAARQLRGKTAGVAVKIVAAKNAAGSEMRLKRHWVRQSLLAFALLVACGGALWGQLVVFSILPLPGDRTARAVRVLAYHRISCPDARRVEAGDYADAAVAVQCGGAEGKTYRVGAQMPCSETLGCHWIAFLCWEVEQI